MKKIFYLFLTFISFASLAYSQGEVEALTYSKNDLFGTARSMSMAGAFGALGGDQTAISINPAGIGVYRTSEIVGTLGIVSTSINSSSKTLSNNDFSMTNFGFVGHIPTRNDMFANINVGFTYNRHNAFNSELHASGSSNSRLIDYIVNRTNAANDGKGIQPSFLERVKNKPEPFIHEPWVSVLGYNGYLINPELSGTDFTGYYSGLDTHGETPMKQVKMKERGHIDTYDFTVGTSIGHKINLGLAISVYDLRHTATRDYLEDYKSGGYTLSNYSETKGAGVGAKFGIIFRPINEIRLGVAYHTPIFYSMTESYSGRIDHDLKAYVLDANYKSDYLDSGIYTEDYNLQTPGKWIVSLAGVLAKRCIISVDYEMTNYKQMKLELPAHIEALEPSKWFEYDNEYIREDHRIASTVKVGMEYRFTPQFSGRLGYAWMQNPYNADFVKRGNAALPQYRANTGYKMIGDANYFTGGFGYRFNQHFFMDLALVYKTQSDDLYPYPNISDDAGNIVVEGSPISIKNNSLRGLLTLGYKF